MTSEIYISQVLAHSLVYESNPHGVELYCCGATLAPQTSETTGDVMRAYTQYFPGLMQAINAQSTPTAQADLAAQQAVLPGQAKLQTDLLSQYGPELTKLNSQLQTQAQQSQVAGDLGTLQGPGQQLIDAAQKSQQGIDPQYYAARQQSSDALGKLMGSLDDPNGGLSGSEQADVERSLNRSNTATGNSATPTATNTVANAMNFGAAGAARKTQKQQAINDAVSSATGVMPAMKSGIDAMQVATGRASNSGTSMLPNANTQQVGQNASTTGNNMFGSLMNYAGQSASANAGAMSPGESIRQFMPNCCWTFMEYYQGPIPWYVRAVRDAYAEQNPYLRVGYKWMSTWLVPLMQRFCVVRWLVGRYMVNPLTENAAYCLGLSDRSHSRLHKFWFFVWNTLGKINS